MCNPLWVAFVSWSKHNVLHHHLGRLCPLPLAQEHCGTLTRICDVYCLWYQHNVRRVDIQLLPSTGGTCEWLITVILASANSWNDIASGRGGWIVVWYQIVLEVRFRLGIQIDKNIDSAFAREIGWLPIAFDVYDMNLQICFFHQKLTKKYIFPSSNIRSSEGCIFRNKSHSNIRFGCIVSYFDMLIYCLGFTLLSVNLYTVRICVNVNLKWST